MGYRQNASQDRRLHLGQFNQRDQFLQAAQTEIDAGY
jgi:hypothetical protein